MHRKVLGTKKFYVKKNCVKDDGLKTFESIKNFGFKNFQSKNFDFKKNSVQHLSVRNILASRKFGFGMY